MMMMYSIHDDDDDDDDDGDDDDDDDDAGWLPLYSIHGSNQVWDQLHPTCFSFPQSSSSPVEKKYFLNGHCLFSGHKT